MEWLPHITVATIVVVNSYGKNQVCYTTISITISITIFIPISITITTFIPISITIFVLIATSSTRNTNKWFRRK